MRRSYRSDKYLGILDRVRKAIPDAAITTDIIIGFPGETEEDFLETIRVVEAARFAVVFTYKYSKRPGTPASDLPDQVPNEVAQERYERLLVIVNDIAWKENQKQIGRDVEVLVANNEGRKDDATHRITGRARDSRLVHFQLPDDVEAPRPGDVVTVTVTGAAPYHLLADQTDGSTFSIRRTAAGDAWDRAEAASCAIPATGDQSATKASVSLGLPTLRKPEH
jgi:tRNA-2-methylthio-N6-dimethylallyladenosine synthase